MAAIAGGSFALRELGMSPEEVRGQRVTAGFFDVLRVRPRLGRAFAVDNESDGRSHVAVRSYGFWTRRFGAEPDIIGETIPIEGGPCGPGGAWGPIAGLMLPPDLAILPIVSVTR